MLKYLFSGLLVGSLVLSYSFSTPSWAATGTTTENPATSTQTQTQRLVIQMNKKDAELQDHVLANIVNLQKHFGMDNIEIELVAYGAGIWFLTDDSAYKQRIESLMLQNVVFTACGNTLDTVEAKDGKRPTLIKGVEVAQAGIARIMERQQQGWNYLSP